MTGRAGAVARRAPRSLSSPFLPSLAGLAALLGAAGCGGGLPLLHPARALPGGQVRAAAGLSATAAVGNLSSAIDGARTEAATNPGVPGAPGSDPGYARGALALASAAPGVAPVAGARVGLGSGAEGGLAYTGRAVRADVRATLALDSHWDLSVGAGGSAALYGRQPEGVLPNVELAQLHGWGADAPILIGYASDGELYALWLGVRGGWEHVDISDVRSTPDGAIFPGPIVLSATRFWGGGVLGLSAGFRHVHVAVEIDGAYASVTGDYNATHASVAGVTLSPASAVWWDF
jgi:hypothetical protein